MPETSEGPVRIRVAMRRGVVLPPNYVWVGYGSCWANPWEHHADIPKQHGRASPVQADRAARMAAGFYRTELIEKGRVVIPASRFRAEHVTTIESVRKHLKGKNVACRCFLDRACHGDALMEVANDWPSPSLLLGPQKQPPSLAIQEAVRQIEAMNNRKGAR